MTIQKNDFEEIDETRELVITDEQFESAVARLTLECAHTETRERHPGSIAVLNDCLLDVESAEAIIRALRTCIAEFGDHNG